MGSSAEHIARQSPVPVLLVHDAAAQAHRARVVEALSVRLPEGVLALE